MRHLAGQGIFNQVKLGFEVPKEMLSWDEYVPERTRDKAAEVNNQKYY